jgi:hypothetical protein
MCMWMRSFVVAEVKKPKRPVMPSEAEEGVDGAGQEAAKPGTGM